MANIAGRFLHITACFYKFASSISAVVYLLSGIGRLLEGVGGM